MTDLAVASLNAGVGTSLLGWRRAGYRVAFAHEPDALARRDLERNWPELAAEDAGPLGDLFAGKALEELTASDVLDSAGVDVGELAVLEGAPVLDLELRGDAEVEELEELPAEPPDWTADLFADFARLLEELRPKALVVTSSPSLKAAKARGYLRDARDSLARPGYRVAVREVETSWLEVPHSRRLITFVGVRDDLELEEVPYPRPLPAVAVRDVLPWVVRFRVGSRLAPARPAPRPSALRVEATSVLREGTEELRPLAAAEIKRLAGVPDDYVLAGDVARLRRVLDSAVPQAVTYHLGRALEGALR